ncbi:MAG: Gfo/Idh/MocA family oxidoreductase [Cyanobacteria bacterium P01_D01_bin.36]
MSKNVGFALLGCGHIAKKHADAIQELSTGTLVAVCDLDAKRAQAFGESYGIDWFTSTDEMMDKKGQDIDVINILTPSGYHYQNTIDLVPYGKHLCVEKPMALNTKDADSMIQACDAAGIHLFVVKQNRFNWAVQQLHQAVERDRLGKLVIGSVCLRWCRPQSYYDKDAWRGTSDLDGGVFANQASHFIDLLQWFMGDVESVFARGAKRLANIEVEDTGVVILKFKSGALGVVEATTGARPSNLEASLSILGEGGAVEIGGPAVNELQTWKFQTPLSEDANIFEQEQQQQDAGHTRHLRYLNTVVETVVDNKPPAVDGRTGRKSLELIEAIYKSMRLGREITMAEL